MSVAVDHQVLHCQQPAQILELEQQLAESLPDTLSRGGKGIFSGKVSMVAAILMTCFICMATMSAVPKHTGCLVQGAAWPTPLVALCDRFSTCLTSFLVCVCV